MMKVNIKFLKSVMLGAFVLGITFLGSSNSAQAEEYRTSQCEEDGKMVTEEVVLDDNGKVIMSWKSYSSMPRYSETSHSPIFQTENGCLGYIEKNGIESYLRKDNLDLERFLQDNPDLVAASIVDRDSVWNWIKQFDAASPRKFHSTNESEEYYCRARNLCIELGVYGRNSTLSVKEKCRLIHDEVCSRTSYDYTYSMASYEDIMDNDEGICNAFATYGMLMFTIAGIENGYVHGPNHVWNAVLAEDGKWYQIDLCWDCNYDWASWNHSYFWMTDRCNVSARNISSSGVFMVPESWSPYIMQELR